MKPRRLYFGPSDAEQPGMREVTFELKWGISLIDFKPTLTTANQIKIRHRQRLESLHQASRSPAPSSLDDPKL